MAKAATKTSAPKKKAADRKAAIKEAAKADAVLDAKSEASAEAEETATEEEPTREAPAMDAAAEPTDFDNLVDLARAVVPEFGSEMAKEGTQHFLLRLLTAIGKSESEQFDTLSLTAQTWYENGCQEGNDKKDITPPDGYTSPVKVPAEKKAAGKKTAGEKAPKAPKEPKPPRVKKEKTPKVRENKTMPVREKLCSDPTMSLEQLMSLFPTVGKSTLSTARSDVAATLKAALAVGWTPPG